MLFFRRVWAGIKDFRSYKEYPGNFWYLALIVGAGIVVQDILASFVVFVAFFPFFIYGAYYRGKEFLKPPPPDKWIFSCSECSATMYAFLPSGRLERCPFCEKDFSLETDILWGVYDGEESRIG